jgi:hypothetical protein
MAFVRGLAIALFGYYASSGRVRGAPGGKYAEQCHPGYYD